MTDVARFRGTGSRMTSGRRRLLDSYSTDFNIDDGVKQQRFPSPCLSLNVEGEDQDLPAAERSQGALTSLGSPSTTTLTSDEPGYALSASDVDRWMDAGVSQNAHTSSNVTRTPRPTAQAGTLAREQLFPGLFPGLSTLWCALAMLVPLARPRPATTPHGVPAFRRLSSPVSFGLVTTICNLVHTSENLLTQMATVCDRMRIDLTHLTQQRPGRDSLVGLVDVVLVIYAFAFLMQAVYQTAYVR